MKVIHIPQQNYSMILHLCGYYKPDSLSIHVKHALQILNIFEQHNALQEFPYYYYYVQGRKQKLTFRVYLIAGIQEQDLSSKIRCSSLRLQPKEEQHEKAGIMWHTLLPKLGAKEFSFGNSSGVCNLVPSIHSKKCRVCAQQCKQYALLGHFIALGSCLPSLIIKPFQRFCDRAKYSQDWVQDCCN